MVPHSLSDSSSDDDRPTITLFRRNRSVHKQLGGRKVADILLWRNRNLSAGILAGATLVWFLFDVVEYNIVTLLCHIALLGMLLLFIWSNAAPLFDRPPPQIPEVIVSEHAFREIALTIHYKLAHFVSILYDIACGKDLKKFLLVIGSLWVVAVVGDTCSFTTLLYIGFLCAFTAPALYERYEAEVDHLIAKGGEDLKKFYKKVDSNMLPDELMIEVLLRLPIKSTLRFRAVCRSWASVLSSEEFCGLHMAKAEESSAPPKLFFTAPTAGFDATAVYLGSSSGPGGGLLFTLKDVRGDFVDMTPAPCHGLTLLYDAVAPAYYVFNAATRAVTRLPPFQDVASATAGLVFDAHTKEHRVVRLFRGNYLDKQRIKCEIYSLGGEQGDCWRPAAGGVPFRFCRAANVAIIQATSDECFRWVKSPPFVVSGVHLVELSGHLCMVRDLRNVSTDCSMLEIWKLNVEKVVIATSKRKVVVYDPVFETLETILAIREAHSSYQTEQSALRVSLFQESLVPVCQTNEEMTLSTPLTKATWEILLRLSGDYTVQSKLVCKEWHRLIENKTFIHSYYSHRNMDRRPKIMLVGRGTGSSGFSFAPINKLSQHTPDHDTWLDTKVVCSKPCHGMNLISTETEDYLYNPCIGYRQVYLTRGPFINSSWNASGYSHIPGNHAFSVGSKNVGLGFNLLMQDHVIVKFLYHQKDFKSRGYLLTCTVTTVGIGCAQSHLHPPLPVNDMPPTYLAGVLYWMSEPRLGQSYERAIVSFDIATKMFDVIPCPSCIAMWNKSPYLAFVAELEGMLCAVHANPVEEELDIWKLENGHWYQAYKVYLKGWSGYSLATNVVVPLAVDPKDGRILLNSGRKLGLYDPARHFIESLYDLDEVLHAKNTKKSSCIRFYILASPNNLSR
ncbi:hypothetical protein EJB05_58026 [Eragrostis curvula]|uniref:Reticulon-like protein n=1 Tax=Eragrostis curvula TaxID=38414 RepID=A0A5J9SD43_9POAL|nr:hypothetical protein EJB05_58026 [Eragrostis curvula]